jgi:hypothetical protein
LAGLEVSLATTLLFVWTAIVCVLGMMKVTGVLVNFETRTVYCKAGSRVSSSSGIS